jgi:hypothetical protein
MSVFTAPANYSVVKIMCSSFKFSLVNYKAYYDLSWFRSLLKGNNHTSSGLILKINMCYK